MFSQQPIVLVLRCDTIYIENCSDENIPCMENKLKVMSTNRELPGNNNDMKQFYRVRFNYANNIIIHFS